jgi:hypothetical protein
MSSAARSCSGAGGVQGAADAVEHDLRRWLSGLAGQLHHHLQAFAPPAAIGSQKRNRESSATARRIAAGHDFPPLIAS